jgi:hypothetical protein
MFYEKYCYNHPCTAFWEAYKKYTIDHIEISCSSRFILLRETPSAPNGRDASRDLSRAARCLPRRVPEQQEHAHRSHNASRLKVPTGLYRQSGIIMADSAAYGPSEIVEHEQQ